MKKISIGIASFAHMHAYSYLNVFKHMNNVDIAGFCDLDENRAERIRSEFNLPFFADYDALARSDADAILVTTENVRHVDAAIAALENGKDVIVEKPIATRLDDAQKMIDLARENERKLFQCYPCRFHPSARKVKDLIASGAAGDVQGITATNHGCMPDHENPETAWFSTKELAGGGAVMDHTTHAADLIFWFTDWIPASVFGIARRLFHGDINCDDAGMVLINFDNGIAASIDPSWSRPVSFPTWGDLTMIIYGTKMTITIDMFNQNINVFSNSAKKNATWQSFGSDADAQMLESYISAIANDTDPPVGGEDGYKALKVALKAYESSDKGTFVDW
ncbi:MAG TPA: Gfo/Idh/MocA family oxidoreductase [Candidatus Lokiarchaeia archaeon]|nr:Gfo/Idh/MocA family oxidoreductase [Candidatus Lokiarchaeia archaeon]